MDKTINCKDNLRLTMMLQQLEPRYLFDAALGAELISAVSNQAVTKATDLDFIDANNPELSDIDIDSITQPDTHFNSEAELFSSFDVEQIETEYLYSDDSISSDQNNEGYYSFDKSLVNEIIFVDSAIDDYAELIEGVDLNKLLSGKLEIVLLDSDSSGIEQISNYLNQFQNKLETVHIVSHGDIAELQLGADILSNKNIDNYNQDLSQWGLSFVAGADLLFYGCNVAEGALGQKFVKDLHDIIDTDIAASSDLTGHTDLGGDWELEVKHGEVSASLAFSGNVINNYSSVLATISVTNLNDSGIGSLRQAVLDANNGDIIDITKDSLGNDLAGTINLATNITLNKSLTFKSNYDPLNPFTPHVTIRFDDNELFNAGFVDTVIENVHLLQINTGSLASSDDLIDQDGGTFVIRDSLLVGDGNEGLISNYRLTAYLDNVTMVGFNEMFLGGGITGYSSNSSFLDYNTLNNDGAGFIDGGGNTYITRASYPFSNPNITITGTDTTSAFFHEDSQGYVQSGALTVTDTNTTEDVYAYVIDISQSGTTSLLTDAQLISFLDINGTYPLPAASNHIINDTVNSNTLEWTFNSGSEDFDYLGLGEELRLTYTIVASDEYFGFDEQSVTVTISGFGNNRIAVTNTNQSGAGSLAEAIANSTDGDTIVIDSGLTGSIYLADNLDINHSLAIIGNYDTNKLISDYVKIRYDGEDLFDVGIVANFLVKDLFLESTGIPWVDIFDQQSGTLSIYDSVMIGNVTDTIELSYNSTLNVNMFDSTISTFSTAFYEATGTLGVIYSNTEFVNVDNPLNFSNPSLEDAGGNTFVTTVEPIISVSTGDSDNAALQESATDNVGITHSGTLSTFDSDNTTYYVDLAGISTSGLMGTLTEDDLVSFFYLSTDNISDAAGNGTIGWQFNSGDEDFKYLSSADSLSITYTLRTYDPYFGTDEHDVTINIQGLNEILYVTNENDSGVGSLREAITIANATTGADVIHINSPDVAQSNPFEFNDTSIDLLTNLAITDDLTIVGDFDAASAGTILDFIKVRFDGNEMFDVSSGADLVIQNLILESDNLTSTDDLIDFESGTITVDDSLLIGDGNNAITLSASTTSYANVNDSIISGFNYVFNEPLGTFYAGYSNTQYVNNFSLNGSSVTLTDNGGNHTVTTNNPDIFIDVGNAAGDTARETLFTRSGLVTSGSLSVKDADVTQRVYTDVVNIEQTGVVSSIEKETLLSYLTVNETEVIGSANINGAINWVFNSGSEDFGYLDGGEVLTLTFTVRAYDDNYAYDDHEIVINIHGTEEPYIVTNLSSDGAVEGSFQWAINQTTNNSKTDIILFDPGLTGTINMAGSIDLVSGGDIIVGNYDPGDTPDKYSTVNWGGGSINLLNTGEANNNLTFTNVHFSNLGQLNLTSSVADNMNIVESYFSGQGSTGFITGITNSNNVLLDNTTIDWSASTNTSPIIEVGGQGWVIKDSEITGNNLSEGIAVISSGDSVRIENMSIHDTSIPIDLGNNGVTSNDYNDTDPGPNNYQNKPVISSAVNFLHDVGSDLLRITGILNSEPGKDYLIEFYGDSSTSNAQMQEYLGSVTVKTDAAGTYEAGFDFEYTGDLTNVAAVTAVATDIDNGMTSELSNIAVIQTPIPIIVDSLSDVDNSYYGPNNLTLREAIKLSEQNSDYTIIKIKSDLVGTATLTSNIPYIYKPFKLVGNYIQGSPLGQHYTLNADAAQRSHFDVFSDGTIIENMHIDRGWEVEANGNNIIYRNNLIENSNGGGVEIRNGVNITVINNEFVNTGLSGYAGVRAWSSAVNAQIIGNTIYDTSLSSRTGIVAEDGATVIGNIIYNKATAIDVNATTDYVTLSQNIMYNNSTAIQIDAGSNDSNDGDSGNNELQNYPAIAGAVKLDTEELLIYGELNSHSGKEYHIEFFGDDNTSSPQAKYYLGSVSVSTDTTSLYNAPFSFTYNGDLTNILRVTATATSVESKATSELSPGTSVQVPDIIVVGNSSDIDDGSSLGDPDTEITLREAIRIANTSSGYDVIQIKDTLAGTLELTDILPDITQGLKIIGNYNPDSPNVPHLTIDGSSIITTSNYVFDLNSSTDGSIIENIHFDGDNATASELDFMRVSADYTILRNSLIENLSGTSDGLEINAGMSVENNIFRYIGDDAINFSTSPGMSVSITNNQIYAINGDGILAARDYYIGYNSLYNIDGTAILTSGTGNSEFDNNIIHTSGATIDIGAGDNDTNDTDSGFNNLQNYPDIQFAQRVGYTELLIIGNLNTLQDGEYRIDIFGDDNIVEPQAKYSLGSVNVKTSGTNNASFVFNIVGDVKLIEVITATATDLTTGATYELTTGATSQLSPGHLLDVFDANVNEPPVALPSNVSTDEDNVKTFAMTDFQFADFEGDDLVSVTISSLPSKGILKLDGVNVSTDAVINRDDISKLTYGPNNDYYGSDTFVFAVNDDEISEKFATMNINIVTQDDIVADAVSTDEDTPVLFDVFDNDTFELGAQVTDVTTALYGTLDYLADGNMTYTPNADFHGVETLTYTVTTAAGNQEFDTITITINSIVDIVDDEITVAEDDSINFDPMANETFDSSSEITSVSQASHGSVVLETDGTVTYSPIEDYHGDDSFIYTVTTAAGTMETATISVTVTPITDILADEIELDEDTSLTFDPLANDTFESVSSVTDATQGAHGSVAIETNGAITYTPDADFNGTDNFTYTVTTTPGNTEQITVTAAVNPVTDVVEDIKAVNEDEILTFNVFDNDTFESNSEVITVTSPTNGLVTFTSAGDITYTPDLDFNGQDTFEYTVKTAENNTETATVTINVAAVSDIVGDALSTAEDTSVTINALTNDNFESEVNITSVTQGTHGIISIGALGELTYTPYSDFNGNDSFTYTVTTAEGDTESATVDVTVTSVTDIVTDNLQTDEDNIIIYDVLSNDTFSGTPVITATTNGTYGTVSFEASGNITYTPNNDFHGTDSFTYSAKSQKGTIESTTVTITVNSIQDANDDTLNINEDTAGIIDLLVNDTFLSTVTLSNVSNGANGTTSIGQDGQVTYSPRSDYNGTDSFTYTVDLANGARETATVTVNITSIPDIISDAINTTEDSGDNTINVLDNDNFESAKTLTAVSQGSNGLVTFLANGDVTYKPDNDFNGTDSFTYTVTTEFGQTEQTTVDVTVSSVDDIITDLIETDEDTAKTVDVLANDTFESNVSVTSVIQPSSGSVVFTSNGLVTYTPDPDFTGSDSFTYTVTTQEGDTETISVTTVVNSIVDISDDTAITNEDSDVTINVISNDDFESTPTITSITQASNGNVSIGGGDTVVYSPHNDYHGTDSFTYTVQTQAGNTETATVTVTILAKSDVTNDIMLTQEDVIGTVNVLDNDSFSLGATLTAVNNPTHGIISFTSDGTITYTPNFDYYGLDTISFTITSIAGNTEEGLASITISSVADIVDDNITVTEDGDVTANLLNNDTFESNTEITGVTNGSNGLVVIGTNGNITYTPDEDFNGTDRFSYTVTTAENNTETAFVDVIVNPEIDVTDNFDTTTEDIPVTLNVLLNDNFESSVFISGITQGANGIVDIGTAGELTYTPNHDFYGTDSFTYTVTTAENNTETANVTIVVNSDSDIISDTISTSEDTSVNHNVLTNDNFESNSTVTAVTQALNGSVTFLANGNVTYTPNADFNGNDSFQYTVTTANGDTETSTVDVDITAVSDVQDDTLTTIEDTTGGINVLLNDNFESNTTLIAATNGSNGMVVFDSNGDVSYTPAPAFTGQDSFTYTVTTAANTNETATVNVIVEVGEYALDDELIVSEDNQASVNVLANDDFKIGAMVAAISQASHGDVVFDSAGNITYTPDADYFGVDSITYTVIKTNNLTEQATINITIDSVTDIADDNLTVDEDTIGQVSVLGNDAFEGGQLSVITFTQASFGTVTLVANNVLVYTPSADYNGNDSFTYTANTSLGTAETATVSVTVNGLSDIINDDISTYEDTAVTFNLLDNDNFESGAQISSVSLPNHGIVTIGANGDVTYTPAIDYNGTDSFTYTVTTSAGNNETADVNVSIIPVTDVVDDAVSTQEDTPSLINPLINDTFGTGSEITAVTQGQHGSVTIEASNLLQYIPSADFNGSDSITYTVTTSQGDIETALITINVTPVSDTVTENISTNEDTPVTIDVLDNDNFESTATITTTSAASHGTVEINNNQIIYTPDADFNGSDSFTYTVTSVSGNIESETVTIDVLSQDDVVNDSVTVDEDIMIIIHPLANDGFSSDVMLASVTQGVNGQVNILSDTTISYTPAPDLYGNDSFTYTIVTSYGEHETSTVNIVINNMNDAVADNLTMLANNVTSKNILYNDLFATTASLDAVTQPTNGTVSFTNDGQITYRPNSDFIGSDSFTYTVSNIHGHSEIGTVTISVTEKLITDQPAILSIINIPTNPVSPNPPPSTNIGGGSVVQGDSVNHTINTESDGPLTNRTDTSGSSIVQSNISNSNVTETNIVNTNFGGAANLSSGLTVSFYGATGGNDSSDSVKASVVQVSFGGPASDFGLKAAEEEAKSVVGKLASSVSATAGVIFNISLDTIKQGGTVAAATVAGVGVVSSTTISYLANFGNTSGYSSMLQTMINNLIRFAKPAGSSGSSINQSTAGQNMSTSNTMNQEDFSQEQDTEGSYKCDCPACAGLGYSDKDKKVKAGDIPIPLKK